MSNTDPRPQEMHSDAEDCADDVELLTARDVPLGGPRAMTVRRSLPQRARSLIGPWCFVDHFGPDDVSATGGMAVPRHPHTGLATVSLLFSGQIDHRDSTGFANTVRPGEVNLMIAGRGVSHSEFSTPHTTTLHGVQLWYALPDALREGPAGSQHHVAEVLAVPGGAITVYVGSLAGTTSPIRTRTPALAAELQVKAAGRIELDLDPESEHGLLVDSGEVTVTAGAGDQFGAPRAVPASDLLYLPPGADRITVSAGAATPARVILIGGPPFEEDIVMWWNFVGRSHEEILAFRAAWQQEIGAENAGNVAADREGRRFGPFPADTPAPLPAPTLPNLRIRPRHRRGGRRP